MTNTEIQNEIKSCEERLAKLREQMNKPKTLEEYYETNSMWYFLVNGKYFNSLGGFNKGCYPSEHTAKKALAQCKLMQIAYILNEGDFIASKGDYVNHIIYNRNISEFSIEGFSYMTNGSVLFKTESLAQEALDGIKSGRFGMTIDELKLALI